MVLPNKISNINNATIGQQTISGLRMSIIIALSAAVYVSVTYLTYLTYDACLISAGISVESGTFLNLLFSAFQAVAAVIILIVAIITMVISSGHYKLNIKVLKIASLVAAIELLIAVYLFYNEPFIR